MYEPKNPSRVPPSLYLMLSLYKRGGFQWAEEPLRLNQRLANWAHWCVWRARFHSVNSAPSRRYHHLRNTEMHHKGTASSFQQEVTARPRGAPRRLPRHATSGGNRRLYKIFLSEPTDDVDVHAFLESSPQEPRGRRGSRQSQGLKDTAVTKAVLQ